MEGVERELFNRYRVSFCNDKVLEICLINHMNKLSTKELKTQKLVNMVKTNNRVNIYAYKHRHYHVNKSH